MKWTFETCFEEALKYTRKIDFKTYSNSAYHKARLNNWLSDICSHMIQIQLNWTFEKCLEEALKYSTRTEFAKNSPKAYDYAQRNSFIDIVCSGMTVIYKNNYWTFELCQTEALKYSTRTDFRLNSSDAYSYATKKKWLDQMCEHMNTKQKFSKSHWTFELCQEEALKYLSRKDFEKGSLSAYRAACYNGWLDKICEHITKFKYSKLLERLKEESLKYNCLSDFNKYSEYYYRKVVKFNLVSELCSHMNNNYDRTSHLTKEICYEEAIKYKTRTEFYKLSGTIYRKATKEGWLDEICSHIPKSRILDYDFCKEVSLRFETFQEFIKNDIHVYNKIKKMLWLELFSHLKNGRIPKDRLIYAFEFSDNNVYIGLTCESDIRSVRHIVDINSSVCKYIIDSGLEPIYKELTEYMEESKASIEEGIYEQYYIDNGWNILNKVKTGSLGGNITILTFEYCLSEAMKFIHYLEKRK